MSDKKVTLDQEQLDQLCNALLQAVSFHNADALEHVMGPCREDFSLARGVRRIADALEAIASALEDRK